MKGIKTRLKIGKCFFLGSNKIYNEMCGKGEYRGQTLLFHHVPDT